MQWLFYLAFMQVSGSVQGHLPGLPEQLWWSPLARNLSLCLGRALCQQDVLT